MSEMMRWDIAQMVESTEVARILKKLGDMVADVSTLDSKYRGKITTLSAKELLSLLTLKDDMLLRYEGVVDYCSLRYSADSTDQVSKQLHEAMRTATTKVGQSLAFMEVELAILLSTHPELVNDPLLSEYIHYLERMVRRIPHVLSEAEEKLIIAKDKNGVNAWYQLQGDWLSMRTYKMKVGDVEKILPYGEIISYYQSADREERRSANNVVYEGLGKDDILWASAIRAVCGDHLQICDIRKYPSPLTQSLIANDVEQLAVESLMKIIANNAEIYRIYLRLKAKLMGFEKLSNWDIVAPLPNAPEKKYSWDESRVEIVSAYSGFDTEFGLWADEMYQRRHIDGEVRKGKRSGAFCSTWLSGKSAWILQSFNGRMGDVYTQAHELGHAIHAYLGSRHQKPSNYEIGSCIAECGSVFGELLLTDQLLAKARTREEKQSVLAFVMDEFGMAAFQVGARYFFEHSMYDTIKQGKFLDGETVSELWVNSRDMIYGDTINWLPEMKWEWTMKVHYYIPNYRFYNYPYVFAQLFVFALYRLYKEQGKSFVPKLKALLSAGSSRSPTQLAAELGFDICKEDFWQKGIQQADEFIKQLEETMNPN